MANDGCDTTLSPPILHLEYILFEERIHIYDFYTDEGCLDIGTIRKL